MIAYNTTFIMRPSDEDTFLTYLRTEYIPMLSEGQDLLNLSLKRIQPHEADADSISLALSFDAVDEECLMQILLSNGSKAATHLTERFGESVVGFSTLMHHLPL